MASESAVYATLLTKASYLPGTLVLEHSLRSVGSRYPLVVLVTPQLPQEVGDVLQRRGIKMRKVDTLQPQDGRHILSEHDARFADTWTKLRAFELVEYNRVVLLDSDMIVRRNMDELMDLSLPHNWIAAAHVCACNPRRLAHYPTDWIPENCAYSPLEHPTALTSPSTISESSPRPYNQLNSGLVVLTPSLALSSSIADFLSTSPLVSTFSFPDQDLLSAVFKRKWKPLPWCYNALKTLRVIHAPLWRDDEVRCIHYILADKPWKYRVKENSGGEYEVVNKWWWDQLEGVLNEMHSVDQEGWELVLANVAKASEQQ